MSSLNSGAKGPPSRACKLVRRYCSDDAVDYENRVVAFIDVLGWSRAVEASDGDPALRVRMLNAAWALAARVQNYVEDDTPDHPSRDEYSQFSDSFVVSFRYDGPTDLLRLVRLVSEFQSTMLLAGFVLRGGITVGPLFHTREIVFGRAMNRAYELESKLAVAARVVVDPSLTEPLMTATPMMPKHWPFVVQADDQFWETDCLTIYARSPPLSVAVDAQIEGWLHEHRRRPNVLAKYEQLAARWRVAKADEPVSPAC